MSKTSVFRAFICLLLMAAPGLRPYAAFAADEEECSRCHGLEGFNGRLGDEVRRLYVSPAFFETSVHSLLNCRECHSDVAAIPHPGASGAPSCGQACHQRDQAGNIYSHESLFWEYNGSVHGEGAERETPCTVCHPAGSLREIARRDLLLEVRRCAACHRDRVHVQTYFKGLHFLALSQGDRRAPACPDCHTAHMIRPPGDDESSVHPERLAETCGSGAVGSSPAGRCHGNVSAKALERAAMTPLPLPGGKSSQVAMTFSLAYWGLLIGLALRSVVGLARKR